MRLRSAGPHGKRFMDVKSRLIPKAILCLTGNSC